MNADSGCAIVVLMSASHVHPRNRASDRIAVTYLAQHAESGMIPGKFYMSTQEAVWKLRLAGAAVKSIESA